MQKLRKVVVEIFTLGESLLFRQTLPDKYRAFFRFPYLIYDPLKIKQLSKTITTIKLAASQSSKKPVVLCLVKNGEEFIADFIAHYTKLGFAHIVFLDNGSTDNTIDIATSFAHVSVLKTSAAFRDTNVLLRRILVMRLGRNAWSLNVDIDELWDYPHSDSISLDQFLNYLDSHKYTGVIAQQLDMFAPKLPATRIPLAKYEYYDISAIRKQQCSTVHGFRENVFSHSDIQFHTNGLRKNLFGLKGIWLTKIPLIKYVRGVKPIAHQHFSTGLRVADLSTVLYHYKFTAGFLAHMSRATSEKQYQNNSYEYKQYAKRLFDNSAFLFMTPHAVKFRNTAQLVQSDFLVVSQAYTRTVNKHIPNTELVK